MRKLKTLFALLVLSFFTIGNLWGTTYKLTQVTSVSADNMYVFVRNSHALIGSISSKKIQTTDSYSTTNLDGDEEYVWTLEAATNGFYIKNVDAGTYLTNSSGTDMSLGANGSDWEFTFDKGVALITNSSNSDRYIGETSSGSNEYKAYSQDGNGHDFTVYVLEEEEVTYTITAVSNDNNLGTVALDGSVITATPEDGCRIAKTTPYQVTAGDATVVRGTGANINKFTFTPTTNCTVQINFEAIPQYTVTWNVNGDESITTSVSEGNKPVFPSNPSACDATSTTFIGWATAKWDGKIANLTEKTVYTSADDMPVVTAAVTYYAVFAKESSTPGAAAGTILYSENFGGYAANNKPSGSVTSSTGYRVVYNDGYVTYTCTNGTKTSGSTNGGVTQIYNESNTKSGEAPEILVGRKGSGDGAQGGSFSIAGIPNGGASVLTVTYSTNAVRLVASVSGTGYSGSNSTNTLDDQSFDITVAAGADPTFTLTFTATTTTNSRLDDISVKIKTAGSAITYADYMTTCTYAVEFDDSPEHGTLAIYDENVDLIATGDEFARGASLMVEATATTEGYKLKTIKVVNSSTSEDVPVSVYDSEHGIITMPAYAITVSAEFEEDKGTDFEDVETSVKAVKVLRDGVLYIEKDGKVYNLLGTLVK